MGANCGFSGERCKLDNRSGSCGRSSKLVLGRARVMEDANLRCDSIGLSLWKKLDLLLLGVVEEGICASVSAVRSDNDGRGRRWVDRVCEEEFFPLAPSFNDPSV